MNGENIQRGSNVLILIPTKGLTPMVITANAAKGSVIILHLPTVAWSVRVKP